MKNSFKYQSDFEGLYLRPNSFKGDTPFDEKKLEQYRKVVQFYSSKLYRFNKHLLAKVGMELEDIESIGHSYVYTFFINNKMTFNDDHHESSTLQIYLRQRYENFIIFIKRKVKGIAETLNYDNLLVNNEGDGNLDNMMIMADDALTVEEILVSECSKKEFKNSFLRYISIVYDATHEKYRQNLADLNLSDLDYRKICLFYVQRACMATFNNSNAGVLKKKDFRKIRTRINNLLRRNEDGNRMKRIKKVLGTEIDLEA